MQIIIDMNIKKQILISTTKELLHLVSFQNLKGRFFKGRLTYSAVYEIVGPPDHFFSGLF